MINQIKLQSAINYVVCSLIIS